MDVVAHGLWGGAVFAKRGRNLFWAACLVGMAPDLLSFGVFHVTHPGWLLSRLAGEISGPPALAILPAYVFYAYNFTHSLIVCAVTFFLLWALLKRPPWLLASWALHILCDIPTHGTSHFPTPFLWPLPTLLVDGITWATPRFMAANYSALLITYIVVFFYVKRTNEP
jgi:membrane-bound metal-dependent hydrolase YbcI (DUF457 family)